MNFYLAQQNEELRFGMSCGRRTYKVGANTGANSRLYRHRDENFGSRDEGKQSLFLQNFQKRSVLVSVTKQVRQPEGLRTFLLRSKMIIKNVALLNSLLTRGDGHKIFCGKIVSVLQGMISKKLLAMTAELGR